MKKWLAKILGVNTVSVVAMERKIQWNGDDAATWASFLTTNTGRKILQAMENTEARANQAACAEGVTDRHFLAGEGSGIRKSRATLITLATLLDIKPPEADKIVLGKDDDESHLQKLLDQVAREPVLGDY